jgi:hypothetical protein
MGSQNCFKASNQVLNMHYVSRKQFTFFRKRVCIRQGDAGALFRAKSILTNLEVKALQYLYLLATLDK